MSTVPRRFLTPQEYLAIERQAEIKSEYYNGEMFAMAGASLAHVTITGNLLARLHEQLAGKPCRPLSSDMRVKIPAASVYAYPDIVVYCGPIELEDDEVDTLLNPTLIIEVLSPSTESYDRGTKFRLYRSIPSLVEYVLVSQTDAIVERYVRQTQDRWNWQSVEGLDAAISLDAIGCQLQLADIYRDVDLTKAESIVPPGKLITFDGPPPGV